MEEPQDYLWAIKSHLDSMTTEEQRSFKFLGLPGLHHLAMTPSKPEDHVRLDKIIKLFKSAGCDLNQTTEKYVASTKRATLGFTPLLVAVMERNLQFVECLLENGARLDISDKQGFLPLHWAVFAGDMACFRKLIEAGGLKALSNVEFTSDVHPILHTAVDEGQMEMVKYFLEHGLVDVHQDAVYSGSRLPELDRCRALNQNMRSILGDKGQRGRRISLYVRLRRILTEVVSDNIVFMVLIEPASMRFTPLARAVRMGRPPIVEMLLKSGAKVSGFSELHYCILWGEVEIACLLLHQFTLEDLATDMIEYKWALHCLHPCAFLSEMFVNKTIELINAYVVAGWDVNSVRKSTLKLGCFGAELELGITILHLACYFKSLELIKHLVETGADVNAKTRGGNILYPLQVSILQRDWPSVEYLLANGADYHAVGRFETVSVLDWICDSTCLMDTDSEIKFSSLELLLQLGYEEGMVACEEMLKNGIPPPERIALQRAMYGGSCAFIFRVVEQLCGVQNVKMEDLTRWVPWDSENHVPSLRWLIQKVIDGARSYHKTLTD